MEQRTLSETRRPSLGIHISLATCSVVGDLPLHDAAIPPDTLIRSVTERMDHDPDLPGVIVRDSRRVILLSRERLHQWLSKPFGTDLFLNRPVTHLMRSSLLAGLTLPADTRIEEAVEAALQRSHTEVHEPLIVAFPNGALRVLDFHVLLLAQTQLLAQANRFISQQVETGRALSQLMDLSEVFQHILNYLSSFIQYDQGSILVVDPEMQEFLHPSQAIGFAGQSQPGDYPDLARDPKAYDFMVHSRQPLLLTEVSQALEWCNPGDFPEVLSWIGFPLVYNNRVICLLSLARRARPAGVTPPEPFTRTDLDLIASLSATFTAALRNAQLHAELRTLAITDPMTGALNRRGFFDTAQKLYDQQNEMNAPCSVLLLDIDFFKRINDTYGHRVGDLVIRSVAQECRRLLREFDLLGRYGGEEFVALLPSTELTGALTVAERLRESISRLVIQTGRGPESVTVSIGIASNQSEPIALEELLHHADEALFRAKGLGRNRFEVWEDHPALLPGRFDPQPRRTVTGPLNSGMRLPFSRSIEAVETESILGWVRVLELRGKEQEKHAADVAELTVRLCRKVGFPESDLIHVFRGSLLHDIGKLAIPENVLNKPGPLTPEEWEEMRRHVGHGIEIISTISYLRPALAIPACHHEKWDGSGYPRGLKDGQIPLEARIFALVDVWDALRSDRCYRPAWSPEQVIDYIRSEAGRHFDPALVEIFLETVGGSLR